MPSAAAQIAEALATGLAAYTFSSPYASIPAQRRYVPDYELADLSTLKVSVVPGPITTERSARGHDLFVHQIGVCLAKQTSGTNADVDALAFLADEIVDAIRSNALTTGTMPEGCRYVAAELETTYERDAMVDRRVFFCQINVTYHAPRPKLEVQP